MDSSFLKTLADVLKRLNKNKNLIQNQNGLFSINKNNFLTPIGDIYPLLHESRNSLQDSSVNLELLDNLVSALNRNKAIIRLNHIGICYRVKSQEVEKQRLVKLVNKTNFHLYQEESNDGGIWLFLGDNTIWKNPMIEIIPIEKTEDKFVDYWLPHVQIDLDTSLNSAEITTMIKSIFGNKIKPHYISIDNIVYIVRNRLGSVSGINIDLDLATNSRNVKYQRTKMLTKISN